MKISELELNLLQRIPHNKTFDFYGLPNHLMCFCRGKNIILSGFQKKLSEFQKEYRVSLSWRRRGGFQLSAKKH